MHGFASAYRLNWVGSRWQETLTNAGFRVIGLDCRGHGHSDKPHDQAAYAVETMANDVVRLLDHLAVSAAAYLGYSMGSRIGLEVMLDFPGRIQRAVLGGIGAAGAIDRADEIARAFLSGEPTDDPVARTFYRFASSPILIVVGDHDEIARGAPELIELIPSARLVTIAGRDHMSAVVAREFKQAALEFLTADS